MDPYEEADAQVRIPARFNLWTSGFSLCRPTVLTVKLWNQWWGFLSFLCYDLAVKNVFHRNCFATKAAEFAQLFILNDGTAKALKLHERALLFKYFSQITAEREKELRKQQEEKEQTSVALKKAKEEQTPKTFKAGIGKYINPATMWGRTETHVSFLCICKHGLYWDTRLQTVQFLFSFLKNATNVSLGLRVWVEKWDVTE